MKAVLFDMDGVIIDSEPIHTRLLTHTFTKYNIPFDPKDFDRYVGTATSELLQSLIDKHCLSVTLDELSSYQEKITFDTIKNDDIEPIEGIRELLEALKQQGIPAAIASSSSRELITAVVNKFGLAEYFCHFTSGAELPRSKPDPAIYLITAKALGVEPKDCLVIEDARAGVQAAKAAGMTCIGFQNPNSGSQNLSAADEIVDSITKINLDKY